MKKVHTQNNTIKKHYLKNNTPLPPNTSDDDLVESPDSDDEAAPAKIKNKIDYQAVMDLYNQINEDTGSHLPFCQSLNDKRKRAIRKLLAEFSKINPDQLKACELYFSNLFEQLRPFHLGENGGWKASFDWAVRVDTLLKVWEDAL